MYLVLFLIFAAFTIGLNLGMHGMFFMSGPESISHSSSKDVIPQTSISSTKQITAEEKSSEVSPPNSETKVLISPPPKEATESLIVSSSNLPSRIRQIETMVSEMVKSQSPSDPDEKVLSTYLNARKKIPFVLLTCNRAEQLQNTLTSLLQVRGVERDNIIVSQDGAMDSVASVVKNHGIKLVQNTKGLRLRGGAAMDGAQRIATHYKFSLSEAFSQYPLAPAIIIIEDDLLFSPDLYDYFTAVAPILEYDKSTFIISAWNDNGFKGKVQDPFSLRRTDYFPGLGWLLTRKLYETELEANWPHQHWDHWLRSPEVNKNREIVHPQVFNLERICFANLD
jgi:hypothetical protein